MEPAPPIEVTRLLARARAGDAQAMGDVFSALYDELNPTPCLIPAILLPAW